MFFMVLTWLFGKENLKSLRVTMYLLALLLKNWHSAKFFLSYRSKVTAFQLQLLSL